jgi:hypothetical protein
MTLSATYDGAAITHKIAPTGYNMPTRAEMGEAEFGGLPIEDPDATLAMLGHRPVTIVESACSQTRLWTGWTKDRDQGRSLDRGMFVGDDARIVDTTIVELNALWNFRIMRGSDAKRPSETWAARLAWILGSVYLSPFLDDDDTYCLALTQTMDAADYTDGYPSAVMNDLASRMPSPINYFAFYDPDDGLAKCFINYYDAAINDSALSISNDLDDVDSDYCFAPDSEAKLTTSPDDVYSEVVLTYNRGTKRLFRRRPSTATKYIARGTTFDRPYVGTFATASTQATDFLNRHSSETDRIIVTLPQVPRNRVGLVRAGQRIDVKFTHITGYTSWTSMRIVSCSPVPVDDLALYYSVPLELVSPTIGSGGFEAECSYVEPPTLLDPSSIDAFGSSYGGDESSFIPADPLFPATRGGELQGTGWFRDVEDINSGLEWGIAAGVLSGPATQDAWWQWDLGDTTAICTIGMMSSGAINPGLSVQGSDNGTDWTEVLAGFPFVQFHIEELDEPWPAYRYWRLAYHNVLPSGLNYYAGTQTVGFMLWSATSEEVDEEVDQGTVPGATVESTSDPTVDDDAGDGYVIGQQWVNTSTGQAFVLVDATTGAAVWVATTGVSLALDDLSDVDTTGVGDGDLLSYDLGTTTWLPVAPPSGSVPDGTDPGDLLAWDGAAWDVVPIGANDEVLTADDGEALGVKWAAGGTSSGGAWSAFDTAPASPNAADDEFNSATLDGDWTLSSQSAATEASILGDHPFDTVASAAKWNVHTDIPGALLMQPKSGEIIKVYKTFAPTTSTRWAVLAKVNLYLLQRDSRLSLGVTKDASPSSSSDSMTDSFHVQIRKSDASDEMDIRAYYMNGGSPGGVTIYPGSKWGFGTAYLALTSLTSNAMRSWCSLDGIGWSCVSEMSGQNINGAVTKVWLSVRDASGGDRGSWGTTVGIVDYIRFLEGDSTLWKLGMGY